MAGMAVLCFAGKAVALDPGRAVSQYIRDHWGPDKGLSKGPVYGITQTKNGYLWVGTEAGLVRFDGLNFSTVQVPETTGLPISHVLGLVPDPDGSLWLRLTGP